ncbi:Type I secretion system ATP-binding protein PrsD [Roseobacter fucihabitans]|uniref:Type I secretion system ATP-binding protein PrsD n=1 Tax=Roseobacter fucihabitans TaxID=1537242 RepID=A0ABZ2BNK5_9RHOB|nr:type I secretion system permease/ATPase [Roseobacter litoralis]MBC6963370.1 Type I secretion system ATP-binding protein PrsD [Roseobacter litoralis]
MTSSAGWQSYDAARRDLIRGGIAAGSLGVFINILHLSLPLFTIQVYDRVLSSGSLETLGALVLLVVIILGFQILLDILRQRIFLILSGRVATRLGRPVLGAAVETSLREGSAGVASSLRDVNEVRAFVSSGSLALPVDIAMTPLFLGVLFLLHPGYGLVGLVGVLLLSGSAIATEMLIRRPAAEGNQAAATAQSETAEVIRHAEIVTAMGMLPALARRWRRNQTAAIEKTETGQRLVKALGSLTRGLRLILQIAIVSVGAILVTSEAASAGTIIAATVSLGRLLMPFEQLIDGWRKWSDVIERMGRMREVCDTGAVGRDTVPIAIQNGHLTVDRLTYIPSENARPILRNVSFELETGSMLGVIGPSGAGKSTLSRMLVGVWKPTAGGVYLDGQSTFSHERGSFGQAVGYLPQEPTLFNASVRDNIAKFDDVDMADVVKAARIAGVHDLIGSLPQGYATRIGAGGVELSGGQKQRVALARAIVGDIKLLVLDEPNAHLDAEGEAALVAALSHLKNEGKTIVVIAQRMSILTRADRLLVLRDGAVANFGAPGDVLEANENRRVLTNPALAADAQQQQEKRS